MKINKMRTVGRKNERCISSSWEMGCTASAPEPSPPPNDENLKEVYVESLTFYRSDETGNPTEATNGVFSVTGKLLFGYLISSFSSFRSQFSCSMHSS